MLTMCRCLMGDPAFMMIDEPTEGLSLKWLKKYQTIKTNCLQRNFYFASRTKINYSSKIIIKSISDGSWRNGF